MEMTAREARYLRRDPIRRMNRREHAHRAVRAAGALILLGIALHLFVVPFLAERLVPLFTPPLAVAAEAHDDAYYCANLGNYMLGERAREIVRYCNGRGL